MLSRYLPPTLLLTTVLVFTSSATAHAQPAPAAPAPPPSAATAPDSRVQSNSVPRLDYPTYVYSPVVGSSALPLGSTGPVKRVWYGWQTLVVVGASTAFGFITGLSGGLAGSGVVVFGGAGLGSGGILLGGPIVHWVHGHVGRGFGAFGINLGMPLVSGALGIGVTCLTGACGNRGHEADFVPGFIVGAGLGLIGAITIDVAVPSYDENVPVASTVSRRMPSWTLVPDLKMTREKTTFGFAGVF